MKKYILGLLLGAFAMNAWAVDLKTEGRDPAYVESIVKRSQKIVDKLGIDDAAKAKEVTNRSEEHTSELQSQR